MQFTEMEFWLLATASSAIKADWALIAFPLVGRVQMEWCLTVNTECRNFNSMGPNELLTCTGVHYAKNNAHQIVWAAIWTPQPSKLESSHPGCWGGKGSTTCRFKKKPACVCWPLYAVVVGKDMAFQPDYLNSDNDKSKAFEFGWF